MKQKKFLILIIFLLLLLFGFTKVYGINFELSMIGQDKIGVNQKVQFYANYDMVNDMPEPGQQMGEILGSTDYTNNVIWRSSNNKVAVVDKNGMVTGISTGTAIISAELGSERPAKMEIEVVKDTVSVKNYEIPLAPNNTNTETGISDETNSEDKTYLVNEQEKDLKDQVIPAMQEQSDVTSEIFTNYSKPDFNINHYLKIITALLVIISY